MFSSLPTSHFRVAVLLGAIALGLGFVPVAQVKAVRTNLLDALKPGLDCFHVARSRWQEVKPEWSLEFPTVSRNDQSEAVAELNGKLNAANVRLRQMEVANAELHRQIAHLEKNGPSPYPSRPGEPLFNVELLEAVVLNRENGAIWQAKRIIDLGGRDGLAESDLVIEGEGPLIDQGAEADLAEGHPVYSGRAVVGRLANVGRLVSAIQKVTDESYRGYAQLIRRTENGFVYGALGVIEGRGDGHCQLRYIGETEPVEVGDDVYTAGQGSQPYPMYYGQVVQAEIKPGDQEWTIVVEPAVKKIETPTVTVLRTGLDANRTLTN